MIYQDLSLLKRTSLNCKHYDKDLDKALNAELNKCRTGIGLSAIQIGVPKRMAVVVTNRGERVTIWDAIIIDQFGFTSGLEGCLSLPGKSIMVPRREQVTILNGDGRRISFYDREAIIV